MIKVEARIKLFDSDDGTVNNAQFNNNNNISYNSTANSSLGQIVGKEVKQTKPFLLDNTPLVGGEDYEIPKTSDMYVLADRVNYFIGSLVSGADGTFPNGASYSITINGADFNAITIVFDKDDEVWPTEITVNGESYTNDDPTFTVGGLGGTVDRLEVTISKLNKPNKGLIVTGIYVDITIVVDEKTLDSFTYSLYDRASNDEPSYGVISNSGVLSFVDSTGEILDYIQMKIILKDSQVEIYAINTITQKKELFVKGIIGEVSYDNDNFVVEVTIRDIIEKLQTTNFNLPFAESIGIETIITQINDVMPSNITVKFDAETASNIQNMLDSGIKNVYFDTGSLWDFLQNLCTTFNLICYSESTNGGYNIILKEAA